MSTRAEQIIIDVELNIGDLQQRLGDTAKRIAELKQANSDMKKELKNGTGDWAANSTAIANNEAEIKVLTASQKMLSGQIRTTTYDTEKYGDSNVELRAQVLDLERQYNSLTKAQKDSAGGQALLAQQNALKEAVKGSAQELGNFQDEVGNYSKSGSKLSAGLDMVQGSAGGVIQGFKGMGTAAKAFIANPIGIVIAAIAGAAMVLYKAFTRTQENTQKLNKVTGALSGIFNNLLKVLEPVAVFIVDNLVKGFELAAKSIVWLTEKIADGLEFIGFESAAKGLRDITAATTAAAKSGIILAEAEAKLEKQQRESRKTQLEYQRTAEKLRQIRDDESRSTAERIKANKDLGEVLKKQSNAELSIANNAVAVAKMRINLNGASKEALDELAEKETEVADIKERITGQESEQLVNINSLRKEAAEKQAAREKDLADKRKARIDTEKEAERELAEFKLKTLKENADADIKALDDEAKLYALRNQERLAGQKLTDEQLYIEATRAANKVYADEEARQKILLEQKQIDQKTYNDNLKLQQQQLNTDLALIDADYEAKLKENKLAAQAADFQNQFEIAQLQGQSMYELKLQQLAQEEAAEVETAKKRGDNVLLIEQKYAEQRRILAEQTEQARLDIASGFVGNLSTIFGKETALGKLAAAAQISIDTYKGAMSAYSALAAFPPAAIAAATAVGVVGAANIKKTLSVKEKFAGGGIVGGTSYTGDKIIAGVNSGEMIFNRQQQQNLFNMIATNSLSANNGINYELLAKAVSKIPAPVLGLREFNDFQNKIITFDERIKI